MLGSPNVETRYAANDLIDRIHPDDLPQVSRTIIALLRHDITEHDLQYRFEPTGASGSGSEAPKLILLKEDNPINHGSPRGCSSGSAIVSSSQPMEAVTALSDARIDLVLMDMQMPVMDGLETTKTIRADEPDKHIPIIALTANALAGDRLRCIAADMDDYLAKPFDIAKLRAMLERWLPAERTAAATEDA